MVSRKIKQQIDGLNDTRYRFQYMIVSLFAIVKGSFYLYYDGYILNRSEAFMRVVPESVIGWVMVISGIILLTGYLTKKVFIKKVGIFALSVTWGGMFLVALTFAMGTGYPDADWIDKLLILSITLRLSKKGVPA